MPEVRENFTNWNRSESGFGFEKYADGKVYAYTSGNDYDIKDNSFAAAARKWGERNGFTAEASIAAPGVVEVRFTKIEQPPAE